MKKLYIIFSILVSLVLMNSCEKDIQFTGEVTNPQLILNSIITPDSVVSVQLSKSKFFLSSVDTFSVINNADVALYINNNLKETLKNTGNGNYSGTYKPQTGDTVKIEVQAPGFDNVQATSVIKPKVQIISIDTTMELLNSYPVTVYDSLSGKDTTSGYQNTYQCHFKLKFKDPADTVNYYRLTVRTHTYYSDGSYYDSYNFDFDDIVSGVTSNDINLNGGNNEYNIFSDDLFNGKEYSLKFSATLSNVVTPKSTSTLTTQSHTEFFINLQSLDSNLYKYLQTSPNSGDYNPLSEPVQVYNNIQGGIGILGSYNSNVIVVK